MARKYDLGITDRDRVFIGEDVTVRCQLVIADATTGEDSVEGDISSNAYRMVIKKSREEATALITLATGAGITFGNGDTSKGELAGNNTVLLIALADTETEKILSEGLYVYDIWRTDAGFEGVAAFGNIFFMDSVSLPPEV